MTIRIAKWLAAALLVTLWPGFHRLHAQSTTPEIGTGALRPGDVIALKVWREPDWSGNFTVDEKGAVILPRLGEVHVTAMSADSLKRLLVDSLARYLRNPSIEVSLLRRIQILGAVRNPGLFPVDPTLTVGDALALAGGPTPEGKTDRVELIRDRERRVIRLSSSTRLADTPIRSGDQLFVPQRSWASRNTGIVAAGITAATSVIVALLIR